MYDIIVKTVQKARWNFMYYYKRLRDLREDNDLKQREIAELLQTTQQVYSEYEKGIREIPLHKIIILAKHYNVSLNYLANLTNEKRSLK